MVWLARRVARHLPLAARPRQARCRRDAGKFARRSPSPGEMLVSLLTQSPSPGEPSATSPTVGLARRVTRRLPPVSGACQGELLPASPVVWLARRVARHLPLAARPRQASRRRLHPRLGSPGELLVAGCHRSVVPARATCRRLHPSFGSPGELLVTCRSPLVLARAACRRDPSQLIPHHPRQVSCWRLHP